MKVSLSKISCIAIFCITLICKCTNAPTAGGTTDTGNAKIAATIYTSDGQPAVGVKVVISPAGYLPGIGADSNSIRMQYVKEAETDYSGYFKIKEIDTGDYFIEINDGDSSAVLLKVSVKLSDNKTISLIDTLRPYASIEGNAGSADSSIKRFLLIYGLDRRILISEDGSFVSKNLPEGLFDLKILSDKEGCVPVEIDSIQTVSSQTVFIPFAGWKYSTEIMLNTTSSGADVRMDVYNVPVLVRLSNSNFNFDKAKKDGSDCRFVKKDDTNLPFEVEQWDSTKAKASIWVLMDTVYGDNNTQSITMLSGNPNAVSAENSFEVFDTVNGLLGNYHFNGNLKDATANRYNGVDSNTYDTPDGIIGRARYFDGYSSFFSIGDVPDRPSGTISFWFKLKQSIDSTLATTQSIWGKKTSDSIDFSLCFRGKDYYTDTGSATGACGILMSKLEDSQGGYYLESNLKRFSSGTWYNAVWCWGNEGNYLYINGVLENQISDVRPISGSGNDEIGRSLNDVSNIIYGSARYFYGVLDEFRFDNRPKDENWVKICYMNQRENDKLVSVKKAD